jgi:hypothetical protein
MFENEWFIPAMMLILVGHEQVIAENLQAGAQRDQTQYSNSYKCPFCGHRWQEDYTL